MTRLPQWALVVLTVLGCGSSPVKAPDAGPDAGVDAGSTGAGTVDAGMTDAGSTDAGSIPQGSVLLSPGGNFRFAWPGPGSSAVAATLNATTIASGVYKGSLHYLVASAGSAASDDALSDSALLGSVTTNTNSPASAMWVDKPDSSSGIGTAMVALLSGEGATMNKLSGGIPVAQGDLWYGANGGQVLLIGDVDKQAVPYLGNLYWADGTMARMLAPGADGLTVTFTPDRSTALVGVNMTLDSNGLSTAGTGDLVAVDMASGKLTMLAQGVQVTQAKGLTRKNFAISATGGMVAYVDGSGALMVGPIGGSASRAAPTASSPALSSDGTLVAYFDSSSACVASTATLATVTVGAWTGPVALPAHFSPDGTSLVYFTNAAVHDYGYEGTAWIAPANGAVPAVQISNQYSGANCNAANPACSDATGYGPLLWAADGSTLLLLDHLFDASSVQDYQGIGQLVRVIPTWSSSSNPATVALYADASSALSVHSVRSQDVIPLSDGQSIAFLAQSTFSALSATSFVGSFSIGGAQAATDAGTGSIVASPAAARVVLLKSPVKSLDNMQTITGAMVTSDTSGNATTIDPNVVLWNQGGVAGKPFMADGRAIVVRSSGAVLLVPVP